MNLRTKQGLAAAALLATLAAASAARESRGEELQRISFRLAKPASAHFASAQEASETVATLKQLGCTATPHEHNGHVDVKYECPRWTSVHLKGDSEVAKWGAWLRDKGFAVVLHEPPEEHEETVKYRLAAWRTWHFHDAAKARAHVELLKMLSCDVKQSRHGDHEDVAARCPGWQALGTADHAESQQWETLLKKLGFATVHDHYVARQPAKP